jgi:DNA invertase Pin-like site-specific DNA recombinase
MRIGYARVSTRDQNLELQLDALNKAGCKRIFTDKLSGAQLERPGLKEALSHLREADTLVVWKLDRLGRSVKGLVDLVNELETQKVHFQSITDGVDTKTPAGRFFFHVMASLAQMERELIMERTRAGLEAARCQGRVGGRKRRMTDSKVQAARMLLARLARGRAQARGDWNGPCRIVEQKFMKYRVTAIVFLNIGHSQRERRPLGVEGGCRGTPPHEVAHSLGVSIPTLYRWVPASTRT